MAGSEFEVAELSAELSACADGETSYGPDMQLQNLQECAMQLPDAQRAALATELLCSLPAVLVDDDGGITEARRRSLELSENPAAGCFWEEIRRDLGR